MTRPLTFLLLAAGLVPVRRVRSKPQLARAVKLAVDVGLVGCVSTTGHPQTCPDTAT